MEPMIRAVQPYLATALLLAAATPTVAAPQPSDPGRQYQECITQVAKDASAAYEQASGWMAQGGGFPARHCAAVALAKLGRYDDAATRFEGLGVDIARGNPDQGVRVLTQAWQTWMQGGNIARAAAVMTAAIKVQPTNPELLINRSISYGATQDYWSAVDDLNKAIDLAPRRADALALRASAYRLLDARDLAEDDVARALKLEPRNADALVERGVLRRLKGDVPGARADWLAALKAEPDGPAGDLARDNLAKLDVNTAK
jgi:tetratricopeptide (TPR) repeat protein